MSISATTDYALRAAVALAAAAPDALSAEKIASGQGIPRSYCSSILQQFRRAGLVHGRRGSGYRLARRPGEVSVADVIEIVEGVEEKRRVHAVAGPLAVIRTAAREREYVLLAKITLADILASAEVRPRLGRSPSSPGP
ncbi:Rrf2 family transcriptional regulator [Spongiactinospora rosea]|uniref:Rrf2 family transcriptional regulator n=2 Tax=Spongiactinospora rosea TaxID=2248750 RepID=A0A366LZ12_9ACTN|nr:Rrf2 family transcriptional regulator [Spongiactinospora rosea]